MVKIVYVDTSALLKRYVIETGSGWVTNLLGTIPTPLIFTSRLTVIEATCAFARRLREGTLTVDAQTKLLSAFDYDIDYRYTVVDVLPSTIDTARRLATHHPLRAYDAMQLATAWLVNQELRQAGKADLIFVTADERLVSVAEREGLATDNPNHHP